VKKVTSIDEEAVMLAGIETSLFKWIGAKRSATKEQWGTVPDVRTGKRHETWAYLAKRMYGQ